MIDDTIRETRNNIIFFINNEYNFKFKTLKLKYDNLIVCAKDSKKLQL